MTKISIELTSSQLRNLIRKLSIQDKIRIFRGLEKETWAERLNDTVLKIRTRIKKNPISSKEITRICEETRQRIYNGRIRSNR